MPSLVRNVARLQWLFDIGTIGTRFKVQGSFISHYLHKINKERKL